MFLIVLVLDDPDQTKNILDAWDAVGVTGATILESTGMARLRGVGIRDDLPLMPSLGSLLRSREDRHRTLFTIVQGQLQVDAAVEATEATIGNLGQDNTGVLFVLPVLQVYGLRKQGGGYH